jgi:hypothetical protein
VDLLDHTFGSALQFWVHRINSFFVGVVFPRRDRSAYFFGPLSNQVNPLDPIAEIATSRTLAPELASRCRSIIPTRVALP